MNKILIYKGLHKVKVVTESVGYYIVEAQESFDDFVDGKKILVKKGEQRIVALNFLYPEMTLLPPIHEQAYELKLEKKLKKIAAEKENNSKG